MQSSSSPPADAWKLLGLSRQEWALVVITMVWGSTFVVVHAAMRYSGPLFFVGLRFLTAAVLGAIVFRRAMAGLNRHDILAGAAIGSTIFLGYGLQTYGLQTITSSQSAFITALYVPLVPLLQWVVLRRPPHYMSLIGVALAFVGLVLLAGPEGSFNPMDMNRGEWATLLGALAMAGEIILISHFAGKVDVRRATVMQLFFAGLFAIALMPVAGEAVPAFSWVWLLAAVGMATASILIQLTMNWAQKTVSPTRATLIYAGEPVWGGVAGRIAGDRLPALAIVGGVLIVLGVIVSELRPSWHKRKQQ